MPFIWTSTFLGLGYYAICYYWSRVQRAPKTTWAIDTAFGCPPKLHGKTLLLRSWRDDGSEVRSTDYSSRGTEFNSQQLQPHFIREMSKVTFLSIRIPDLLHLWVRASGMTPLQVVWTFMRISGISRRSIRCNYEVVLISSGERPATCPIGGFDQGVVFRTLASSTGLSKSQESSVLLLTLHDVSWGKLGWKERQKYPLPLE